MKFIKSKKSLALLATLAVAVIAAVGAYAYFSSTGHGSGTATVGQSSAFDVNTGTTAGGPMTPAGGAATYETETYTVHNPSSGSQNLNQVEISVAGTDVVTGDPTTFDITGPPDCTAGDFQLSLDGTTWATAGDSVTDSAIAGDLASGADSATHTVHIRMVDTGLNQDACQLADVPLYFAAS